LVERIVDELAVVGARVGKVSRMNEDEEGMRERERKERKEERGDG